MRVWLNSAEPFTVMVPAFATFAWMFGPALSVPPALLFRLIVAFSFVTWPVIVPALVIVSAVSTPVMATPEKPSTEEMLPALLIVLAVPCWISTPAPLASPLCTAAAPPCTVAPDATVTATVPFPVPLLCA